MDTTNVHVISQEILKPSSQTPNQLKYHKLSLLDQIAPPVYIPLIFFYQANDLNGHDTKISENLKRSLSQTLTTFYPLAGKLDGQNSVVNCNDEGIKYVEARVHARMSDVIQDPRAEQLEALSPVSTADVNDNVFLAVQINFFQCGGIAIGVCLSHYVADGVSTATFVNSWAAMCRGDDQVQSTPRPSFDLADHFPSRDLSGSIISMSGLMVDGDLLATKRFVFDKEKLAALRKSATISGSVKDPTRVELVSGFIWKSFVHVAKSKESSNTIATAASQVVNLRNRTKSVENVFGNCIMNPGAIYGYDHKGVPKLHDLVPQFRTKIRSINNEYIEKSKNIEEDVYVKECEKALELLFTGEWITVVSLVGVDFLSTRWITGGESPFGSGLGFSMMNYTVLMDTKSGDGVEAWVSTLRDNVESLESHFGLLKGAMADGL